jgi:conjugative relaxase-like TrwC/TraI family protein
MLSLSKPLSAAQLLRYHAEEFVNARENYYTDGDQIRGVWRGQLAQAWGLQGEVDQAHFRRLAQGQHPITGEQLVRHHPARRSTHDPRERAARMAHRAGWDATFSAPKSVSLTALVGGDARVRAAHQESVIAALDELEHYTQARMGGNRPAHTTQQCVATTFEHDSARPVDGYAAPQLHTHAVIFNLTETEDGVTHALQPRELYRTQQYATAVYRSELATRLTALGYEIERGKSGQPEILGYSQEYLDASSPRRQQIQDYLTHEKQSGPAAAQIAAHQTRGPKLEYSHDEMQSRHRELAEAFGHQPARVVEAAQARAHRLDQPAPRITPQGAVTFAKEKSLEREAVVDERTLLRHALTRSMGEATAERIKSEFESRVTAGEFVPVDQRIDSPGRAFTTQEMLEYERHTIQRMREGQRTQPPLVGLDTRKDIETAYQHLSDSQRIAVQHILASRDQTLALEGVAGAGKTTALSAVRDAAEREGYRVEGFAPTSRAAQKLAEAGMATQTLQAHLMRRDQLARGEKRLYVLDESSLASTKQMHAFLHRLGPEDRLLLVGDVRQHQAVEAGRPYQQLQDAGIDIARLDTIVRQKDPALRTVVEHLSRGDVCEAIHQLDAQGRVHEVANRAERLSAIARAYTNHPESTLVVSPDNQSRLEINQVIHRTMQTAGLVNHEEHRARVLIPRQDITGADRKWANQYEPGDVVRYTTGSKTLGLEAGEYARVEQVNGRDNLLAVRRQDGERVMYDPRRLQGVMLYREADRAFAKGDRVQVTAPHREQHVANRELGTVDRIDRRGHLHVRLDSGRTLAFTPEAPLHLDHGYAVTSHSSQGQTADRVLVHVDTERAGAPLINRRLAYVAVSRGRYDAHIYTNDKTQLANTLNRDVSHRSALEEHHLSQSSMQRGERSRSVQRAHST